ncbi:hypothetical protein CXB51_025515 [Gossypium anomalum]|uniref:Uncharacterized protein n=1 Tax=Gossypium anomalum TaxID=47600 RepID=A0A8J5YQY1_9ROSI|nr:hypothetical protein CXB51_025515 [Gossypium anomalum]
MAEAMVVCMNAADHEISYADYSDFQISLRLSLFFFFFSLILINSPLYVFFFSKKRNYHVKLLNSSFQKEVMLKLRPIIEESITLKFSNTMKVADLGRSSGPNTFMTISHIIDTVHGICQQEHLKLPKFKVLLNDLPENDFNAVFKSVPGFFERLKKEKQDIMQKGVLYEQLQVLSTIECFLPKACTLYILPVHFIGSQRSDMVPRGLENKRGTYIWQDQVLPMFYKLMWTNFRNTFTNFPSMRSNGEIVTFEGTVTGQKEVMLKLRPIIEESITLKFSNTMKVADLGRSSGPNTFMTISHIIDTVHGYLPKFKVLLNDLPENDFNAVFKSVPGFFERLKKEKQDIMQKGVLYEELQVLSTIECFLPKACTLYILPVHFIGSQRSDMVPRGLENKRGTYIWQDQVLPMFYKLMWTNFRNTFTNFPSMRSKEIIPQGRMVLTLIAGKNPNPCDEGYRLELLAKSLLDLVAQLKIVGSYKEADVDSFNLHLAKKKWLSLLKGKYLLKLTSSKFFTEQLRNKDLCFNFFIKMGKNIANTIRAILEPIFYCHFEDAIIEEGLQQMQQIL